MWRIKAELIAKTVMGYVVILLALFSVSWICDKVINTLIILMSYGGTRWVFPLTYHAKSDKGCIMFTIACFSIAIIISLPINISIVASVIVGMAISTFLFFLQYFLDLQAITKVSDKEAFVAKCKSLNYGELKTEIALKFFVEKLKTKEVWEWLCNDKNEYVEYDSVKQMKWRMKKEIFN